MQAYMRISLLGFISTAGHRALHLAQIRIIKLIKVVLKGLNPQMISDNFFFEVGVLVFFG
jgi:hypothetical protein